MSRLVEGRALTGTTEGAIRYGLEKTATIITGAAAVMAFVFLAFAISPVANTRQFGIGLTVAVVLDATVVRLILLPALIRFFGERPGRSRPGSTASCRASRRTSASGRRSRGWRGARRCSGESLAAGNVCRPDRTRPPPVGSPLHCPWKAD